MMNQTTLEIGDAELVARAKAGELDAFEALANRYEQRVYSLALRMLRHEQDAEDVTQQAFLSALESLDGFRGDASFATWLLRIATHAALKVIRKQKGLNTISLEEATEAADNYDSVPHPEDIADWRSRRSSWCRSTKSSGCWRTRWPNWMKSTAWCSCCGTWKVCP